MTASGGLAGSRPTAQSMSGMTPRMTMGPIHSQIPQPVRALRPTPMKGSSGMVRPSAHR